MKVQKSNLFFVEKHPSAELAVAAKLELVFHRPEESGNARKNKTQIIQRIAYMRLVQAPFENVELNLFHFRFAVPFPRLDCTVRASICERDFAFQRIFY